MLKQQKASIWKSIAYGFALLIFLFIFSAYYAPDMMIAISTQVWALCGW
ncbi:MULTISPECIES: hypothetical protein [Polynucleobacter]|nr:MULTISPECIES: hypothetical protein [Polynucleobacter]MBU3551769.1 hypothetical protein [Polynucleobacter sp. MWH-Post4-6-1]MBU3610738.1 hypothetical protein [Polynucleobacter wuianus]